MAELVCRLSKQPLFRPFCSRAGSQNRRGRRAKPPSPIPRIAPKVASKRATFAPKRGIGEGGFFPPQRNRMGTNYGNRRSSGGGAAVPIAVFPKNRGLVPMSVPILFPLCSHPCSHQRKMAGTKKRITKPFFCLRTASWEQSILSINKKRI